ncbi:ArsR/SmtB family transcription factor, partial [Desulfofalx alkaliphila]|uniref:ArsR/SmtB family transcription factor n=1 Tax=Desulfofalx alkaliphila TaxID=105483 RepID=UPI0004E20708
MENKYRDYALLMKALSDETRVKIFHMLSQGELCACKILDEFNIKQPTLSYHMKILSESGLVNGRRDGVWMKYTINKDSLVVLNKFFNDITLNLECPEIFK